MSTVGTPKSPEQIQHDWNTNPRWKGIERTYTAEDVVALQGHVVEESTLARRGAEVLWEQLHEMDEAAYLDMKRKELRRQQQG